MIIQLCPEGAAQGIGREIPKGPLGPVDVLEHALCRVLRAYAQIFLIFFRPYIGQLLHIQVLFNEHFLNLITDQHVKAVAQFICLGADQARGYFVDGLHEPVQVHLPKLPGEHLLHLFIDGHPERTVAANDVLKEPGL